MMADWLEFVRRVLEFPGFNLGQRLANVTEEFVLILSSPKRPDRLWGPQSFLFKGHRVSFPRMEWR
jgi:hypothetical protein